jgi:hypothetical protein
MEIKTLRENNRRLLEQAAIEILFESPEKARELLQKYEGEAIGGGVVSYGLYPRKNGNYLLTRTVFMDSGKHISNAIFIMR